jgi:hypothetical protein
MADSLRRVRGASTSSFFFTAEIALTLIVAVLFVKGTTEAFHRLFGRGGPCGWILAGGNKFAKKLGQKGLQP